MDLNGDGLLTADEYRRWLKRQGAGEANKKLEADRQKQEEP
jgi:hypothetical protein